MTSKPASLSSAQTAPDSVGGSATTTAGRATGDSSALVSAAGGVGVVCGDLEAVGGLGR